MKKYLAGGAVAVAVAAIVGTVAAAGGPPQFLTFPILLHVGEDGLDHGHFVFSEESAIPTPLARDLGAATAAGADFSAGSPLAGLDVDATLASADSYEGETSAAATAGLIVGGANHIYPGNCNASAAQNAFGDCAPIALSSTDGVNFVKQALPRNWNNTNFGIGFDPAVDVDKNGTFYFSYGVAPLSGSYPNAIVVAKSTNGTTWTKTSAVTFNRNRAFDDKYYMAIDRSNTTYANRIYVSWDRNQGNNQILYISSSSNGGNSWTSPVKVNDGTTSFERVIGAYPAVDQNSGVVYDSWHDYAKDKIFVDKSTNGGVTWGTDRLAATTHTGFGVNIGCVGGRAQSPAHALKVGPSGALYLVYADQVQNRGFDILFAKSSDGGVTWSIPVRLNDDAGAAHQFHPTLSVGPNDVLTVTFYDRRDDSNNCLSHVYSTISSDGGATWGANVKVTTAPSNFDGNPNGPGDYSSSTLSPGVGVYPFFSDHRSTNPETSAGGAYDVYTANIH